MPPKPKPEIEETKRLWVTSKGCDRFIPLGVHMGRKDFDRTREPKDMTINRTPETRRCPFPDCNQEFIYFWGEIRFASKKESSDFIEAYQRLVPNGG